MQIWTVLGHVYDVACRRVLWNGTFKTFNLTPFSKYVISEIQKLWGSSFISKCSKFNLDFENAAKNSEKVFCFWDNRIWIVVVKLSLLRTGCFSSVANVWTTSPKNWHVNRRDFFENNFFASDQWICQKCCDTDFNSVFARLPCCLSKGSLKRYFLDIYLTTFPEFLISEIHKLWGSSYFQKCSKCNLILKM